jgi:3-isopropylmalate/(R)-2-methylmalate dehydratase small subunit
MTPLIRVAGLAVVLPLDNVDTDQLIPARFMSRTRAEGYGEQLLFDLRHAADGSETDSPLNRAEARAVVLVAGSNFGCGSSREAAVYALVDYGIRVVVARSFADIFRNNAARNGLMTILLDEPNHAQLSEAARNGELVTVDLEQMRIETSGGLSIGFDLDKVVRRRLMTGLDELSDTLQLSQQLDDFASAYFLQRPWSWPGSG